MPNVLTLQQKAQDCFRASVTLQACAVRAVDIEGFPESLMRVAVWLQQKGYAFNAEANSQIAPDAPCGDERADESGDNGAAASPTSGGEQQSLPVANNRNG